MSGVMKGQRVKIRSGYQARGFRLAHGEHPADDPTQFDRSTHAPKLIPLARGEVVVALTRDLPSGEVFGNVERDGERYACLLLSDSFDLL